MDIRIETPFKGPYLERKNCLYRDLARRKERRRIDKFGQRTSAIFTNRAANNSPDRDVDVTQLMFQVIEGDPVKKYLKSNVGEEQIVIVQ